MFLHTNSENLVKCRLEPTQTATTSKILCWRHGPIWPKLERHVVPSPTCRDMSATFPAKVGEEWKGKEGGGGHNKAPILSR